MEELIPIQKDSPEAESHGQNNQGAMVADEGGGEEPGPQVQDFDIDES